MPGDQLYAWQPLFLRRSNVYTWQVTLLLFRQTHKAIKTQTLSSIKVKAKGYDVVAVDEGQFF